MRSSQLPQRVATALGAALLLLAPTSGWAEHHEEGEAKAEKPPATEGRKPWDQAKMTQLSAQLAAAMREVRQAFRREPGFRDARNPNQRANHNMEQTLRGLETASRQLSSRVSGGGGFDETLGIARRIGMLLNDAEVEGRRIMTSEWMNERIRPAMELINQIAPFYGSGPLFDPETMQRID